MRRTHRGFRHLISSSRALRPSSDAPHHCLHTASSRPLLLPSSASSTHASSPRYPITSTADLRSSFLSYFASHGHLILPSASLIPASDPSLLFTAAGMVPLKPFFLSASPPPPHPLCASSQLCLRTADLPLVGFTSRHLTLFEMLGNFAFRSLGREEAVSLAWAFITSVLRLEQDRLRITVLHGDDDCRRLWQRVTGWSDAVLQQRIISRGRDDNYWTMGAAGPAGPCTELYYDTRAEGDARWLEVWNVVFMQEERQQDGSVRPLQQPSVDTGMGLERMASVLQAADSNFDIDVFRPIVTAARDLILSTAAAASSSLPTATTSSSLLAPVSASALSFLHDWKFSCRHPLSASFAVILDHIRAIAFLFLAGVVPSNTGRGHVLRRILRRCLTHAFMLGVRQPFLSSLYPAVEEAMGNVYPELVSRRQEVQARMAEEERVFYLTLERGLRLLDDEMRRVSKKGGGGQRILGGEAAFLLYDSCGFPLDLTEMILARHGWTVDTAVFDRLMQEQRDSSRAVGWKGSGEEQTADVVRGWAAAGMTNAFSGHDRTEEQQAAVEATGSSGDFLYAVIDPCPFYAAGGGQVSDCGSLVTQQGSSIEVLDCLRVSDQLLVLRLPLSSAVQAGDFVTAIVDPKRADIAVHHTATHLLHAALRRQLSAERGGTRVQQAGSLVTAERLRFDFSFPSALSAAALRGIESAVNAVALQSLPVTTTTMPRTQAEAEGATALFSDKYGEEVRVVKVGDISAELCGGTHAANTALCWPFVLTGESSVSAGIRRLEAVSGRPAVRLLMEGWELLRGLGAADGAVRVSLQAIAQDSRHLQQQLAAQQQEIRELRKRLVGNKGWPTRTAALSRSAASSSSSPPLPVVLHLVPASDAPTLSSLHADALALSRRSPHCLHVLLCSETGGCMIAVAKEGGRQQVAVELWQRLMSGLKGAGGKGGGSNGLVQGRLPLAQDGTVSVEEVWSLLVEQRERLDAADIRLEQSSSGRAVQTVV